MPLGLSGCCQERETLFRDVFSFLMTVTGEGAVGRHSDQGKSEVQWKFRPLLQLPVDCLVVLRFWGFFSPAQIHFAEFEGDGQEMIYSVV